MSRTYLPSLFALVAVLCSYIGRWRVQIDASLPDAESRALFATLANACEAFLALRPEIIFVGE